MQSRRLVALCLLAIGGGVVADNGALGRPRRDGGDDKVAPGTVVKCELLLVLVMRGTADEARAVDKEWHCSDAQGFAGKSLPVEGLPADLVFEAHGDNSIEFEAERPSRAGRYRAKKGSLLKVPSKRKPGARRLEIREAGESNVLIVRVSTPSQAPTLSATELSDLAFSREKGRVTLASQFDECSMGALQFVPKEGFGIVGGVVEVTVAASSDDEVLRTTASDALTAALRVESLDDFFDHIMFVLPPGSGSWLAYAYLCNKVSVFNDDWAGAVSAQMHEVGHNLCKYHSGEGNSEYGDQSSIMGSSFKRLNGPKMCFDAAMSFDFGWYADHQSSLVVASQAGAFQLVGLADYKKTQDGQLTVLRVTRVEGLAMHLMYNRKSGVNGGVNEFEDQVTVVSGGENQYSTVLAGLSSGQAVTVPAFDGGFDLVISVCEMSSSLKKGNEIPYAAISVHLVDGAQASQCATPPVPCIYSRGACGDDSECCSGRCAAKQDGEKTCRAGMRGAR
ncbi:hypothetical protein M885DRAFT_579810 [Pelagophyceae sp. CCMP2097]|nr:hypothetical protein M885DRAFT_579810 [Pelagophyceae sp. CCMP2097]